MLGTFWPPGDPPGPVLQKIPEEAVAGQFTRRSEGRWKLELIESLLPSDHPSQHDPNESVPNYDVIFGASRTSTCLSLFGAWRSSFSLFSALQDRETWDVGWYAEGDVWIEPDDEIRSIEVEYDLLSDWGWPQHQPSHDIAMRIRLSAYRRPRRLQSRPLTPRSIFASVGIKL